MRHMIYIFVFVSVILAANPWAKGSDRPRMTYLSSGPVPLFFRTKPIERSIPEQDDLTRATDSDNKTDSEKPEITESDSDSDPIPGSNLPEENSAPEQLTATAAPDELSEPLETRNGDTQPVEVVADTSESPTGETELDNSLPDNGEILPTVGSPDTQLGQANQDTRESDAFLDKLRWNLNKYRSGNLSSLTDLPVLPANLLIGGATGSDPGLSIRKRPDIDLLGNSYFGKTSPVNSPDPQWEVIGDAILQEIQNLSSGAPDGHIDTERKPAIRKPYPFGFRAPGPVWMPANSSATYSIGNE